MFTYIRKYLRAGFKEGEFGMFGKFTHSKDPFFGKYQVNTSFQITIMAAVGVIVALTFVPFFVWQGIQILLFTSPVWLLFLLPKGARYYWSHYIQHRFLDNPRQAGVLLEVQIPREIQKSPRAMELVFEALYLKPSVTTPLQVWWHGHVRPWWAFEIVSDAGNIHFYIWTWKRLKLRLENTIYAQYPEVRIFEVEDYAKKVKYVPGKMEVVGASFVYEKDDAHPLKSYYDFELNKDPKTEFKIDPLVSMLEMMSSIKSGHVWLQYCIQQAVAGDKWKTRVEEAVQKIYDGASPIYPDLHDPDTMVKGSAILRPMQYEYVKAMQRATLKSVFDVGIRAVYIAKPEDMKAGTAHNLFNMFKLVGSPGGEYYNILNPDGDAYLSDFDWPWEDFRGMRQRFLKRKLLRGYTARSYFHPPVVDDAVIMTSEHLATLYHFPGEESQALGIERLESKRSGPPLDLPI
jgi:hypothetical protein